MYKMYSRVSTTVQGSKDTGSRLNVKDENSMPQRKKRSKRVRR
jgi:hypothetical protein